MASFATLEDLEVWLDAPLAPSQVPRAEALLEYASALVATVAGHDRDLEIARGVTVQIALRRFLNPGSAEQETTGPFAVRWGTAGVFITAAERGLLSAGTAVDGLASVRVITPLPPRPDDWWADEDAES